MTEASQPDTPTMQKLIEVLLVEDDPGEALLVGEILAESELPVNLRVARDGMEALLMIASGPFQPDLIIVDLNIPYISGHGVIEQFHPKDIPVVAFTASLNEADKWKAFELGARDYVRKPTDLRAYTEAVRGIVEKWARREPK
jgi:CheY-like chemotaxis protein